MRKEVIKQKECPECGNKAFVEDFQTGEIVCAFCGLVLSSGNDLLSSKPEWRAYNDQEHQQRSRTAPLTHRTQIGVTFGKKGEYKLPTEQIKRLRRHQSQVKSSKERNLIIATQTLQTITDKLNLPKNTRELAMIIYKKALEKDLVRGRTITCMVAASIYFACRILQIPRYLSDFPGIIRFSEKEIANNYSLLHKELNNELDQKLNIKLRAPDYLQSIEPITENLHLSRKTAESAAEIIRRAKEERITQGKGPKGIMGAAIYIACRNNNEKRTQKEIAEAAGITEVTIRNRSQELQEKLKIDATVHIALPTKQFKIKTRKEIDATVNLIAPSTKQFEPKTQAEITKKTEKLMQECFASLRLPDITRKEAQRILDNAINKEIDSLNRRGFVAAIILIACVKTGQDITEISIARAARTNYYQMNKRYEELRNVLGRPLTIPNRAKIALFFFFKFY